MWGGLGLLPGRGRGNKSNGRIGRHHIKPPAASGTSNTYLCFRGLLFLSDLGSSLRRCLLRLAEGTVLYVGKRRGGVSTQTRHQGELMRSSERAVAFVVKERSRRVGV